MRLNGWQRLWLVGTVCLGLWLVGWWPLQSIGKEQGLASSWYDRQAIEKDFQQSPVQGLPDRSHSAR